MRNDAVLNNIIQANQEYYNWIQNNSGQNMDIMLEELENLKDLRDNYHEIIRNSQGKSENIELLENYLMANGCYCIENEHGFSDYYFPDGTMIENPLDFIEKGVDVPSEMYECLENAISQINYEKKIHDNNVDFINILIQKYEDYIRHSHNGENLSPNLFF